MILDYYSKSLRLTETDLKRIQNRREQLQAQAEAAIARAEAFLLEREKVRETASRLSVKGGNIIKIDFYNKRFLG